VNGREYAQVQLISPLQADTCYLLRFQVAIPNYFDNYQVTNFDAYFSPTAISSSSSYSLLPYAPQFSFTDPAGIGDTTGWYAIQGIIQAQGGEDFLTIGNFHDDASTTRIVFDNSATNPGYAYYLVDSVSLVKVPCPIDIGIPEQEKPIVLSVFPNPSAGIFRINSSIKLDNASIFIYDITGRLIRKDFLGSMQEKELNYMSLSPGLYYYSVVQKGKVVQIDKIIISK
jgi:hypothetical protein